MRWLSFERSEGDDGVLTLDAMAAFRPERKPTQLAQAQAEAQAVLAWAWANFPDSHAPVEDGGDWLHDLQQPADSSGWMTLTLTFSASAAFAAAFEARWGESEGGAEGTARCAR